MINDAKSAFHERKKLSLFKKTNMEEDRILKNYLGKTCYSLIVHFHVLSVNEDVHIWGKLKSYFLWLSVFLNDMVLSFRALSTGLSGKSQWAGLPHDNGHLSVHRPSRSMSQSLTAPHSPSLLPLSPIRSGCKIQGTDWIHITRRLWFKFEKLYCLGTHYSHLQLKNKCGLIN